MQDTSQTLLERLRNPGDAHAWERFVALYSPMLLAWCRRAGLDEEGASDLTQEVLMVALRELPRFRYDPAKKNFRGWLKTITFNKCRDRQRQRLLKTASDSRVREVIDDASMDSLWDAEYRQHMVQRALEIMRSDFAETTWKACWETTVEGRAARDVAEQLGMSEAAVYVAKSRVLKRLREEMREFLD